MRKNIGFVLAIFLLVGLSSRATDHMVSNKAELDKAIKESVAGDQIIMQKGVWSNVKIIFEGNGTEQKPIILRAALPGQTILSGNSTISIGGSYLVVEGIFFHQGISDGPFIEFRKNDQMLANHCRVTNCAIFNYTTSGSSPKDNNWIVMWGKYNRIDHCKIGDKLNGGTTLIVNLNDERSQNNFHSIDSNYFSARSPLGRNGGETIRIGVSKYSLTNSNTVVRHNYFERCNGEEEIISVKSCYNSILGNTFFECEGSVVLRHGNHNLISDNSFLGNHLPNTGAIRIINPDQTVMNNLAVACMGDKFRSALAIMNGVPNSPLDRYFQVKDSKVQHNSFIDCASIVFGLGKDAERTLPPENVLFEENFVAPAGEVIFQDENKDGGINILSNATTIDTGLNGFKKTKYKELTWHGIKVKQPVNRQFGANLEKVVFVDKDKVGISWSFDR